MGIQEKSEKTETVDHNSNSGKLSPVTNAKRRIDWAEKHSNEQSKDAINMSPSSPTLQFQNTPLDNKMSDSVEDPFVIMDKKLQ